MPHFTSRRSSESSSPPPEEEEEPPRLVRTATLHTTTPGIRDGPLHRQVLRRRTDGGMGEGFGAGSHGGLGSSAELEGQDPLRLTFTPRGNAELEDLSQLGEPKRHLVLLAESQLLIPRTAAEQPLPAHWRAASNRIIGDSSELTLFLSAVRAAQSQLCELTGDEDGLHGPMPNPHRAAALEQRITAILSANPFLRGFCERLHADHELWGRNRRSSA